MNTQQQLSLLRPPPFEVTERGRLVPGHWLGVYSRLLAHVGQLRCRGRVPDVRRRRRWSNDGGYSNRESLRLLGIDRRQLAGLEAWGLIQWDGDTLVLPHYHRSSEAREEDAADHMRRLAVLGGRASGEARRRRANQHEKGELPGLGSGLDPSRMGGVIREVVSNVFAHLGLTAGSTALDTLSGAPRSSIPARSTASPALPDGTASKNAPLPSPLILKRMAAASAIANRVLRTPEKSAARTGRARSAARAASSDTRQDMRRDRASRATKRGRGPDFGLWYSLWRRGGGQPYRRQLAGELWARLDMTDDERRALWACTQQLLREHYDDEFRAPNSEAFLDQVWRPALQRRRRDARRAAPTSTADLVAAVVDQIKTRREGQSR